jgi:hypothetical protein
MMGLLLVLCAAQPERITLVDPENDVCGHLKIQSQLTPKFCDEGNIEDIICPKSHPVYCVDNQHKRSRCLTDKYFKSLKKDTKQEFAIENFKWVFYGDKNVTCQFTENLLDLKPNVFKLLFNFGSSQKEPYDTDDTKDEFQCILIGHQYKKYSPEMSQTILYYKVPKSHKDAAKPIKHRTGFQTFHRVGQMHYDFLSCSATRDGIIKAKRWYDDYQKPWYQKCSKNVKQWYRKYRNTWEFWIAIITIIVLLFGVIGLSVYYCYGNYHAEPVDIDDDYVADHDSNYSPSESDYVINVSDLQSMQSTQTNTSGEDSAETINSVTSITAYSTKSHSTDDLSFSSEVELTADLLHVVDEVQDTKNTHHSQSKTKVQESEDIHHFQSETDVQEPAEKYHSNSESDFSI